ncbi:hypothetical protein [Yinghuangia sp. YIM S09857]|uniref:hypothetical protein n=1 Tax=Yinghuangia sp. YIM S09857 TaxID=3436929 RepID=UPI003F535E96
MSSIALDIRDIPDLADDLGSPAEQAGADRPERTGAAVPGRAADPAPRFAAGPARLRCADCGTVLAADEAPVRVGDDGTGPDWHADDGGGDHDARAPLPSSPSAAHAWRIPVHAVGPASTEPFSALVCPGSQRPADPESDAVPEAEPEPPTTPPRTLPADVDWRAQPFSHAAT